MTQPAMLGGPARFPDGVPFVRPALPPLDEVVRNLAPSYDAGQITDGPLVRRLEDEAAGRLGVEHVVAVASCTVGLMLAIRALEVAAPVVLPSFTFAASAHAVAWNGLAPRFAECDSETFQIDVADATARLDGAGALLATHVFGAPCRAEAVEAAARAVGIPAVFDAAHAFGASRKGRPIGGFGAVEIFSLTPTKPLVAGEGGLVATDDPGVAKAVRIGRNYGNPGNYDSQFVGLNGRMSEFHAATALASLKRFDEDLERRRSLAARYQLGMESVPGVVVQPVDDGDLSSWKDLTVQVDADRFGVSRDLAVQGLAAEGVDTRKYFSPPVHRHRAYRDLPTTDLPVTDLVAGSVLSLPIWPDLAPGAVDGIVEILGDLHDHRDQIGPRSG